MTTTLTTRIITTLLTLLCCIVLSFSQGSNDLNNHRAIGITFSSLGENEIIRFEELDGGASYDGDGFFSIGINYLQSLNKWITLETGLEYAQHSVTIQSELPPDIDSESRSVDMALITFPLSIRAQLSQYFFINTGLLVDIDVSGSSDIDSQTGLGGLLGLGGQYKFQTVFLFSLIHTSSYMPWFPSRMKTTISDY